MDLTCRSSCLNASVVVCLTCNWRESIKYYNEHDSLINNIPLTKKTTLLLWSYSVSHTTDTLFQVEGTITWMLYCVSLGQEPLYKVRHVFDVFLQAPLPGSSWHRVVTKDAFMTPNDTTIGKLGLGFNSHSNVTLWFTATILDGITVKLLPAEKKIKPLVIY